MSLVPAARFANLTVLVGIGLISVDGQLLTPSKGKSVSLEPGSRPSRLVLAVAVPPAPGDRVEIRSSSQKIEMTIVTPDGRRIDAKNAKAIGFDWSDEVDVVPLGEDTGHIVRVVFRRPDLGGSYVVEFAAPDLKRAARADVRFVSRLADYAEQIRSAPGAQIRFAQVRRSADIAIDVQSDYAKEDAAFFEIALTAPVEKLTLTLPGAKVLSVGSGDGREYSTFELRYGGKDPDLAQFWAIPMDGIHHRVSFPSTPKGRYVVHVESAQTQNVVVVFGPFKEVVRATGAWARETPEALKPRPGNVSLDVQRLPFDCYAGDKLTVTAKLPANIGKKTTEFTARIQTQPLLASTDIGMRYADAGPVETQPLTMKQDSDGAWRGDVTIKNAGMARVSLRVSGETAQGAPFTEEILLTNSFMIVYPIVARLVSLTARPVDQDGDGKFDRLDVTSELEVFYPGTYQMGFTFTSGGHTFRANGGKSTPNNLARGRRSLTISFPSHALWSQLRDGPLVVGDFFLLYKDGGYLVKVPNANVQAQTAALKREQWYPGKLFGDDTVTIHGTRPAQSGRFRFLEVEWQVTTPGGQCSWNALFRSQTGGGKLSDVRYYDSLPTGPVTLSFIFEGGVIAGQGKDWSFGAGIRCGRDDLRVDVPNLAVDPAEFEPAQKTSFSIYVTNPVRVASGGSISVGVGIGDAPDLVGLRAEPPQGLNVTRVSERRQPKSLDTTFKVEVEPGVKPGRYAIPIVVDTRTETARTELLVDVVGK